MVVAVKKAGAEMLEHLQNFHRRVEIVERKHKYVREVVIFNLGVYRHHAKCLWKVLFQLIARPKFNFTVLLIG